MSAQKLLRSLREGDFLYGASNPSIRIAKYASTSLHTIVELTLPITCVSVPALFCTPEGIEISDAMLCYMQVAVPSGNRI